jgi:hypothetical protein
MKNKARKGRSERSRRRVSLPRKSFRERHNAPIGNGGHELGLNVVSSERPNLRKLGPVVFDKRHEAGSEEVRAYLPDHQRGHVCITVLGTEVFRWR